jgi:hypothetical protein
MMNSTVFITTRTRVIATAEISLEDCHENRNIEHQRQ